MSKGVPNPDRVRAENERRRSSVATPQETRWKRQRTDERVIAAELEIEGEHDGADRST